MAQTFGQFLHECENYQYSQEYFDILKESMEIDLMELLEKAWSPIPITSKVILL